MLFKHLQNSNQMKNQWLSGLGLFVPLPDNVIYTDLGYVDNITVSHEKFLTSFLPGASDSNKREIKKRIKAFAYSGLGIDWGSYAVFEDKDTTHACIMQEKQKEDWKNVFTKAHEETHLLCYMKCIHLLDRAYEENFGLSPDISGLMREYSALPESYLVYVYLLYEMMADIGGIYGLRVRGFEKKHEKMVERSSSVNDIPPELKSHRMGKKERKLVKEFQGAFAYMRALEGCR